MDGPRSWMYWGHPNEWDDWTDRLADSRSIGVDLKAEDLPTGSCVRRTYLGVEHTVYIVTSHVRRSYPPFPYRYLYRYDRYKTLSAVARKITGNKTLSGNVFFGLRRRRR